jgi:K+-sensing histidine kinase KdpD
LKLREQEKKKHKHVLETLVTDDGFGIDKYLIPQLFKTFAELKKQQSDECGTGIGLACAQMIVDSL